MYDWVGFPTQVTYSSIVALRSPLTEEPGRLQSMGCKESDTTEWLPLSFSIWLSTLWAFSKYLLNTHYVPDITLDPEDTADGRQPLSLPRIPNPCYPSCVTHFPWVTRSSDFFLMTKNGKRDWMSLPKLNYENTVASVLGSFIFSSVSLSPTSYPRESQLAMYGRWPWSTWISWEVGVSSRADPSAQPQERSWARSPHLYHTQINPDPQKL